MPYPQGNWTGNGGDKPLAEQLEITPEILKRIATLSGNGLSKADIAGCLCMTDKTFQKLIKKHTSIRMAMSDGRYASLQNATGKLQTLINQGNPGSIMFYLKCQWKWRDRDKPEQINILQQSTKQIKIDFMVMDPIDAARVYQQLMKDDEHGSDSHSKQRRAITHR